LLDLLLVKCWNEVVPEPIDWALVGAEGEGGVAGDLTFKPSQLSNVLYICVYKC